MAESLIKAYGLYWVRDAVAWKNKELRGLRMNSKLSVRNKNEKKRYVDVWRQRGVYVLYSDWRLVYVGLADANTGIGERLHSHHTKPRLSGRWDSFSWFSVDGFDAAGNAISTDPVHADTSSLIRTLELILILSAEPPMNRAGGRFQGAENINQIVGIRHRSNAEIYKLLEELKGDALRLTTSSKKAK